MYILSQDKKRIINLESTGVIEINRNIGGKKEEKYALTANSTINAIALYPDLESAEKALVTLLAAVENDEKVYYL